MPRYPLLKDADLQGKRVLLRAGFDVPVEDGKVTDETRVEAIQETMTWILNHGASLILMAHQGRPKGKADPEFSQKPLVPVLKKLLGRDIQFADSCTGPQTLKMAKALKPGEVLLLENLRYDAREEGNDEAFGKELAALGDVYVNDAFTNCHRAHASMVRVPAILPHYMGLQLEQEVRHLSKVLEDPKRPLTLIISGVKLETKIPVIEKFLAFGDDVLLGGAVANTFLAACDMNVAKSKFEPERIEAAQNMMLQAEEEGHADIHIPTDVIVAAEPTEGASSQNVPAEGVKGELSIFDLGTKTLEDYCSTIEQSGTIVWNGPLGMMEVEKFAESSKRVAEAIKRATAKGAISVIGGGDTIDFHTRYGLPLDAYTFVSTGGGAMLEFMSGEELPALAALA